MIFPSCQNVQKKQNKHIQYYFSNLTTAKWSQQYNHCHTHSINIQNVLFERLPLLLRQDMLSICVQCAD